MRLTSDMNHECVTKKEAHAIGHSLIGIWLMELHWLSLRSVRLRHLSKPIRYSVNASQMWGMT